MSRSAVVHLCSLPLDLCRCEVTTMSELREVGTLSLSVMIESAVDVESSGGGFVCTL
jgi:hypothetical protein